MVMAHTEYAPQRVRQIGYDSLVKAQAFIEPRTDYQTVRESGF